MFQKYKLRNKLFKLSRIFYLFYGTVKKSFIYFTKIWKKNFEYKVKKYIIFQKCKILIKRMFKNGLTIESKIVTGNIKPIIKYFNHKCNYTVFYVIENL